MSVDRSITISVSSENQSTLDCFNVITQNLWSPYNHQNQIRYLPLGDTKEFDFESTSNMEIVTSTLESKFEAGEFFIVGLSGKIDDENLESIDLWIFPKPHDRYVDFDIRITLGVGKRLVHLDRFTDYSYYLNQLLPVLNKAGFQVGKVVCEDIDWA